MALLLTIITLSINITENNETDIVWIKNAYKQCKFDQDVSGSYSMNQSSWIFYNTGAIFGTMLATKKLPLGWWRNAYYKRVARGVISGLVSYGIYFGFSRIEAYDKTSEYAFNYAIPAIICSYSSFGFTPLIFQKLKMNAPITSDKSSISPERGDPRFGTSSREDP